MKKNPGKSTQMAGGFAILGPKNTYSDLAATRYFEQKPASESSPPRIYLNTITDIFDAVEKGAAAEGIAPLENVIYGSVRETLDQLFVRKVHIIHKLRLKIEHALVTLPATKKSAIRTISSHEQAIQQCSIYLEKNFRFAQKEYSTSTISALEKMVGSHDETRAVIIPARTAKALPLKIIATHIENSEMNYTTFIVLEKGDYKKPPKPLKGNLETAVAFYFRQDSPGRLYMVFREFANAGINLSHIESRPSTKEVGNFIFFLQFEGSPSDPLAKDVLESIAKKVAGLKILGVYTKA